MRAALPAPGRPSTVRRAERRCGVRATVQRRIRRQPSTSGGCPAARPAFQAEGSLARVRETAIMMPMPATIRQAMAT